MGRVTAEAADAQAVFAGLARHHGPGHLTRAVLEGVAFNLYTGLLAFAVNGTAIEAVVGGTANRHLRQFHVIARFSRRLTSQTPRS